MRILVVEDEKKIAEFIRKGLTEHGYAVDVAVDGVEALDWPSLAAENGPPRASSPLNRGAGQ